MMMRGGGGGGAEDEHNNEFHEPDRRRPRRGGKRRRQRQRTPSAKAAKRPTMVHLLLVFFFLSLLCTSTLAAAPTTRVGATTATTSSTSRSSIATSRPKQPHEERLEQAPLSSILIEDANNSNHDDDDDDNGVAASESTISQNRVRQSPSSSNGDDDDENDRGESSETILREIWNTGSNIGWDLIESVASRVLDPESTQAIKTVRDIITSVDDHGVVDVFQKYKQQDVWSSIYALSRLQRAAQHWQERLQVMSDDDSNDNEPKEDNYNSMDDYYGRRVSTKSSSANYPIVNDTVLLDDLAHYAIYANTAYGWTMDFVFGPEQRRLSWPFGRKLRQHRHPRQHDDDGGGPFPSFPKGNLQTLLRRTGIPRRDVVAAVWESKTHRPAYFLVRDHAKKTLVLCVRGTYSAHDVLTDLCCTVEEFQPDPTATPKTTSDSTSPSSSSSTKSSSTTKSSSIHSILSSICFDVAEYCCTITSSWSSFFSHRKQRCCGHHGMLSAARALDQDAQALVRAELEAYPDYSLVLLGHSMGGGVAALLGTLWEDVFGNNRLKAVYVYGPPCVAPLDAQPTGTGNGGSKIVSVVMQGDPFGRWSLGHVADVSVDLAHLCENEELRRVIFLHTDGKTLDLDKADLQWCAAVMEDLRQQRGGRRSSTSTSTTTTLYPPGRILYLSQKTISSAPIFGGRRTHRRHFKKRSKTSTTTVRQVPPEFFQDLIISPSMFDLTKHVPALYESSLRAAATQASTS